MSKKEKENTKEESTNEIVLKTCFFVTPIGDDKSQVRRKTDGLINQVLIPTLSELDFEVICSHQMDNSGSITGLIIRSLINSDLVVVNLTGLNPNVMYELAVRHAKRKPVVCIAEYGTILPFDVNDERTIFYSDDIFGAFELKEEIKKKVEAAMIEKNPDNVIYRHIEYDSIFESVKKMDEDTAKLFFERMNIIERKLDSQQKMNINGGGLNFYSAILRFMNITEEEFNNLKMFIPGYFNNLYPTPWSGHSFIFNGLNSIDGSRRFQQGVLQLKKTHPNYQIQLEFK